jgi:molybdopterin molybdotransferase
MAISVDEARALILDAVTATSVEQVPLLDALGLTLASDVAAPVSLPPFDASAVDGYAVWAADTTGATRATPVRLTIAGEALPGAAPRERVEPGSAIRIMTGAPVPPGATAIVPFEETDELERARSASAIQIFAQLRSGDGVRPAGSGIPAGAVALRRGTWLRPSHLGTLASLGLTMVGVHRRPRIALLTVGDQFAAPGGDLGPAQVYEANEIALAGAVREAGGVPLSLGIAADQVAAIGDRLRAAPNADLVVLSGGVAHGAYDVVRDFLTERGRLEFWRVAMRPGRPCGFGWLGDRPLISLAGNPGAALVGFEQFVRPAIRKLLGRESYLRPEVDVVVHGTVTNADGRRLYVPARVDLTDGGFTAFLIGFRGRSSSAAGEPNALVIVPETCAAVNDGDSLRAQLLGWND